MKTRLTLLSLSLLAACGQADPSPTNIAPATGESAPANQPRQPSEIGQALTRSAAQYAIPQAVLSAVAYAQTRLYFCLLYTS